MIRLLDTNVCDILIAGHALAAGLTLITANTREFTRIRGRQLEDWRA